MTHTQQFIEDAVAGGWRKDEAVAKGVFENGDFFGGNAHWKYPLHRMIKRVSVEVILIDPQAWQSVGKTREWLNEEVDWPLDEMYIRKWHAFIDLLAAGKTIEDSLAAIADCTCQNDH